MVMGRVPRLLRRLLAVYLLGTGIAEAQATYRFDTTIPSNAYGMFVLGRQNAAGSALCNNAGYFCTFTFDATGALRISGTISGGGDGAIVDGISAAIKATVLDLANSNPLTVGIVDASGNQISSFGGGTQYNQGTPTTATDALTMAGAIRHDTATVDAGVADADRVGLSTDALGRLRVTSIDVTQPVTGPLTDTQLRASPVPVSGTVTVTDGAGALNVIVDSGSITTVPPSNASTNVAQLAGTTTSVNSGTKDAGTLRVVLATDQPALTNKLLVTPDSVALPANQSVNVAQLAATTTDTNSGLKSAGTLRVVLATDQPALTNKLLVTPDSVALPANQSVNLNQVAGGAVTTGNGTAAGAQRMSLASDSTGNIATIGTSVTPGTAAANLGKAEDAVAGSADTGVMLLGVRNESTTLQTSATGDYGALSIDGYGVPYMRDDHPNAWYVNTLSTATTLTEIKAVPGAGLSLYVSHIDVTNSVVATATADAMPTLKYGTGTNCATGTTTFWRCMNSGTFTGCLSSGGNINPPIKLPANNALCFITTPAGTRAWNISGFTAP